MFIDAYLEEWSRLPGEIVRVAVSSDAGTVEIGLERIVGGPGAPGECAIRSVPVDAVPVQTVACQPQSTAIGSYADLSLADLSFGAGARIECWIWPTIPGLDTDQPVWSLDGVGQSLHLILRRGRLTIRQAGMAVAESDFEMTAGRWYKVEAIFGADSTELLVRERETIVQRREWTSLGGPIAPLVATRLLLAAADEDGTPATGYNGKIDGPTIYGPDGVLAAWSFTSHFSTMHVLPAAPRAGMGLLVNGVERAVTGHLWDGSSLDFTLTPDQYSALQFHDDDMVDCNWPFSAEFRLPEDLPSGVYAVVVSTGDAMERWPLFVGAQDDQASPILVLFPTNTYMAYANDHLANLDFSASMPHAMVVPDHEKRVLAEPAFGRSLYDTHSDGTAVRYTSRRRPIPNSRPNAQSWLTGSYRHFPVDLYLIEWLEALGLPYTVATDEDVERGGSDFLARHRVMITGSHPEYWTREGLDALQTYVENGGRLMYLGGNGFYWVSSRDPERPWIMEVRRDNSGTRCWNAPLGEMVHATSGERGGIWRYRGRASNKLVGLGFSAEGWSQCGGFRRTAASYEGLGATLFAGIEDEVIGADGFVLGGAVGDEVDRYDITHGSPPHALLLASSIALGREYQLVIEDVTLMMPDQDGVSRPDMVRSDIVYFDVEGGGAVFAAGSIAYIGALPWNGFANPLSQLTQNVLQHLLKDRNA